MCVKCGLIASVQRTCPRRIEVDRLQDHMNHVGIAVYNFNNAH